MPYFECRDIGTRCEFEARADTEEVLMDEVVKHLNKRHYVKVMPPHVQAKVKKAINK